MKLTPEQQARIDKAHDEAQARISEAFTEGMIDLFSMFGKPERWSCTEDQDLANFTAEIEKLIYTKVGDSDNNTGTAPELPTVLNPENVASTDVSIPRIRIVDTTEEVA